MNNRTIPDVFIIESLGRINFRLGSLLSANIKVSGKNPIFMSAKNKLDFINCLEMFKHSII